MRWMTSLVRGLNRRNTVMSLLALGIGATAFGVIRRRRNGTRWQQWLQPLRGMLPTR